MKYLAVPYSHEDIFIKAMRADHADMIAAYLMKSGIYIFSPISSWHYIANKHVLPTNFEFWKNYNFSMLSHCDALLVITLDGWKESVGVKAEMDFAKKNGIPIHYVDPDTFEITQ
jgi:hypothetical protein